MYVPMDYHILFLAMSFIVFIITIFLIFVDTTLEKTVGAMILCTFNIVLNMISGIVFAGVDIYGYDNTGAIVHNVQSTMHPFIHIYVIMTWVTIMLMVYCAYIFVRKPWVERMENNEIQYPSEMY